MNGTESQEEYEERLRQLARIYWRSRDMQNLATKLGRATSGSEALELSTKMKVIAREILELSEGHLPGSDA